MSVQALSSVLERSEARLGARLVQIALANHAHDDGSNAYMSQETIAREARMTARQVRRCLKQLEAASEIVRTGTTSHGVIVWQICPGGQIVHGHPRPSPRTNRAENGQKCPPNRSNRSNRDARGRATPTDYDSAVIG